MYVYVYSIRGTYTAVRVLDWRVRKTTPETSTLYPGPLYSRHYYIVYIIKPLPPSEHPTAAFSRHISRRRLPAPLLYTEMCARHRRLGDGRVETFQGGRGECEVA